MNLDSCLARMCRKVIIFACFLAYSAHGSVLAKGSEPSNQHSASLRTPSGMAKARLIDEKESASLELHLEAKTLQREEALGQEFIPILLNGKEDFAPVIDLDKDGTDELFVRVGVPPHSGALYLFRWDAKQKRFAAVPFQKEEFLVVDYAAPVKLESNGNLEIHLFARFGDQRKLKLQKYRWQKDHYQALP